MRQRCNYPKHSHYNNYGGKGIIVCERWESFANFYADMGPKPHGASLDRIDNDKGYCPENCRWATRKQQNRNTRANRMVTINQMTLCVVEWAELVGEKAYTIYHRLRRGWPEIEAVFGRGA